MAVRGRPEGGLWCWQTGAFIIDGRIRFFYPASIQEHGDFDLACNG